MEIPSAAEAAGITLKPSGERWNLAQYHEIGVDVKNVGSEAVTIRCEAISPATNGKRHSATAGILCRQANGTWSESSSPRLFRRNSV